MREEEVRPSQLAQTKCLSSLTWMWSTPFLLFDHVNFLLHFSISIKSLLLMNSAKLFMLSLKSTIPPTFSDGYRGKLKYPIQNVFLLQNREIDSSSQRQYPPCLVLGVYTFTIFYILSPFLFLVIRQYLE